MHSVQLLLDGCPGIASVNLDLDDVRKMPAPARQLLGFDVYDGTARGNGVLGSYEMGSPKDLFSDPLQPQRATRYLQRRAGRRRRGRRPG